MRSRLILIAALAAGSAAAQAGRWFTPLERLQSYLQLTGAQVQTILSNNDEYNRWSWEKQNRIRQVQVEITEETAKEPLDPGALGIRYAEIEAICREMLDRANQYRRRNMDVLTAEQKTKLQVLEEAMKLAPVISEAQYGNLIGGFTSAPPGFTGTSTAIGGGVIGGIIGGANGCYLPFAPIGPILAGDFTAIPPGRAPLAPAAPARALRQQ